MALPERLLCDCLTESSPAFGSLSRSSRSPGAGCTDAPELSVAERQGAQGDTMWNLPAGPAAEGSPDLKRSALKRRNS